MSLYKAKKGTPQYEEWLRKYQEKRRKKLEETESKKEHAKKEEEPAKSSGSKTMQELLDKPPVFVKDKALWEKAVKKVTHDGERESNYGTAVTLYKLKLKKEVESSKKPEQLSFFDDLKDSASAIDFSSILSQGSTSDKEVVKEQAAEDKPLDELTESEAFDRAQKEAQEGPDVQIGSAATEDIRVLTSIKKATAGVKVNPELLEKTQQPVFANLFGHYPIKPIEFQDRTVTSPVEEIDVALAQEPEFMTDDMLNSPKWIATEKCDGMRATLICTPEATRITGRRQQVNVGKKAPTDFTNNLPHIRDIDLYSVLGDTVIDSESIASNPIEVSPGKWGDSLASTEMILGQKKDLNVCVERMNKYGRVIQMCFDIQRFQGKDLRDLPYSERMQYLDKAMELIAPLTTDIKRVTQQRPDESRQDFFKRIVDNSGEGCVLANADGPYKAFDRKNRIKMKRQLELTLQVMSIEEGTGRNKNAAGALVMGAVINGKLTPVCNLNVGSDELRKDAWEHKDRYLGRAVETKAMQMTLGGGTNGMPRLRHARWKTPGMFRDEKQGHPDDLTEITALLQHRRNTGKQ